MIAFSLLPLKTRPRPLASETKDGNAASRAALTAATLPTYICATRPKDNRFNRRDVLIAAAIAMAAKPSRNDDLRDAGYLPDGFVEAPGPQEALPPDVIRELRKSTSSRPPAFDHLYERGRLFGLRPLRKGLGVLSPGAGGTNKSEIDTDKAAAIRSSRSTVGFSS